MVKKTDKCSEYVELIHLAFDGDLDENARKVLDEHAKTCADCAGEMHLVDVTRELLDDLPALEVPRGFNDAVLASVRRARAAERTRPTAVWLRWATGLTAAAAGISAAVDPGGHVVSQLPLFEEGVIVAEIRASRASSFYGRYGDAPVLALLGAVVLAPLARRGPFPRPRDPGASRC